MTSRKLMSQAEYARHRGCNVNSVYNKVRAGALSTVDGKLDPKVADREWAASKRRTSRKPIDTRTLKEAEATARAVLKAGGEDPGEHPNLTQITRANDLVKLHRSELELRKAKGETVSKADVEKETYELAREFRDALLNWPVKVAAVGEAELGLAPGRLLAWLDREVRKHLALVAGEQVKGAA